jgi:hypothetical protein
MSLYRLVHLRFGAHALWACTCDQWLRITGGPGAE